MVNVKSLATESRRLTKWLGLTRKPVAVAFRKTPPPQVSHIDTPEPAGCGYWRLAAEGRVFYTAESDHYHCPIGAYTHGITLPPQQAQAFDVLVQDMVGMGYIRKEDLQAIPRRTEAFGVAVYAPLARVPCEPDVVIVLGNARQLMLLAEAAQAAGLAGTTVMGRPTCAMIPEAMRSGKAVASFGCTGNRIYTGAEDDEAYYAIPGGRLTDVVKRLATVSRANQALESFHKTRKRSPG